MTDFWCNCSITFVYEACQAVEPIQNGFGDELNGFGDALLNLASPGGFATLACP